MKKIIAIEVRENYRVWLRFDDGAEGEVDLSVHVGKGVFAPWADYGFFRKATVGESGRTLTWPGALDLCADALWLQVTGKKPEDLFPTKSGVTSPHSTFHKPGSFPTIVRSFGQGPFLGQTLLEDIDGHARGHVVRPAFGSCQ